MMKMISFFRRVVSWAKALRQISHAQKIMLGSGPVLLPEGWVATNKDRLDVTLRKDFARYWKPASLACFFAEHVWEHLEREEAIKANANCFEFLRKGGRLRVAVPDGFHPDPVYRTWISPGGNGPGAKEHKVCYTYRELASELASVGFEVELLEYWDEKGHFHFVNWNDESGRVNRSSRYDQRNVIAPLSYTSLIVDAIKPCK